MELSFAIKNSDKKTIAPRINAHITLTPIRNRDHAVANRLVNVRVERDPFPALEIYRRAAAGDSWATVLQDPSGGQAAFSLWPPAPNHVIDLVSSL